VDRTALFDIIKFSTIIEIAVNWFNKTKDPITVLIIIAEMERKLGKTLNKKDRVYARHSLHRKLRHLVKNGFLQVKAAELTPPRAVGRRAPRDYLITEAAIEIVLNSTPETCVDVLTKTFGTEERPMGTPHELKTFAGRKEKETNISARADRITYEFPSGGKMTGTPAEIVAVIQQLGQGQQQAAIEEEQQISVPEQEAHIWSAHQTNSLLLAAAAAAARRVLEYFRNDPDRYDRQISIRNLSLGFSKLITVDTAIKSELARIFVAKTGVRSGNMTNSSSVLLPDETLDKIVANLHDIEEIAKAEFEHDRPFKLPVLFPPVSADEKQDKRSPCVFKSNGEVLWEHVGTPLTIDADPKAVERLD
jgi:hypothetical protein